MIDNSTPDFHVVRLDDLPPLFALLERMKVAALLDELFPQPPNWEGALSFGQVAVGWQVYLLSTGDHCLNHVQDWVAQRLPVYSACLGRTVRAFFAGGNGGQVVMVVAELDLVIAFFGGNYSDKVLYVPQRVFVPEFILPATDE